jgi:outer membrane protein OmpA-like peptidoglycan-associated protein
MKSCTVRFSSVVLASFLSSTALIITGCSNPQPGPDKSAAGAILGAAWGAGAGAVVGNQVSIPEKGVAVGAGFGAAAGLLQGMGYDLQEGVHLEQNRQLASLKIQAAANERQLQKLQGHFDNGRSSDSLDSVYQVFFDEDQTNLRSGAVSNLETVAEAIKNSNAVRVVHVAGHTDDTGNTKYNESLSQARAASVSAYLAARGIGVDQINVKSFGATKPIATNRTAAGRQLNRRVDVYVSR